MNDRLFHVIEDAQAVIVSKGLYKQVKLYRRDNGLYANVSGGFIRLLRNGGTSKPDIRHEHLHMDQEFTYDSLGRIELARK